MNYYYYVFHPRRLGGGGGMPMLPWRECGRDSCVHHCHCHRGRTRGLFPRGLRPRSVWIDILVWMGPWYDVMICMAGALDYDM